MLVASDCGKTLRVPLGFLVCYLFPVVLLVPAPFGFLILAPVPQVHLYPLDKPQKHEFGHLCAVLISLLVPVFLFLFIDFGNKLFPLGHFSGPGKIDTWFPISPRGPKGLCPLPHNPLLGNRLGVFFAFGLVLPSSLFQHFFLYGRRNHFPFLPTDCPPIRVCAITASVCPNLSRFWLLRGVN